MSKGQHMTESEESLLIRDETHATVYKLLVAVLTLDVASLSLTRSVNRIVYFLSLYHKSSHNLVSNRTVIMKATTFAVLLFSTIATASAVPQSKLQCANLRRQLF